MRPMQKSRTPFTKRIIAFLEASSEGKFDLVIMSNFSFSWLVLFEKNC